MPWTFFATAIANAATAWSARNGSSPRFTSRAWRCRSPSVRAALVDCVIAFGLLVVMMVVCVMAPGALTWQFLLVPLILAVITLGAMGVGTLLAGLHVAYRDFRYVTPFMVQLWMFATPTLYNPTPPNAEKGWMAFAMNCQPDDGPDRGLPRGVPGRPRSPWLSLGISTATMALLFVVGCFYFRKVEDWFADII